MTSVPLSIAADHPAFAGHFPGRPIVPGVVLLDECLRAIGVQRGAATRIAAAKFLSMVVPGEIVRLDYDDGAHDGSFRMRLYAGTGDDERLAMSGTVEFAPTEPGR